MYGTWYTYDSIPVDKQHHHCKSHFGITCFMVFSCIFFFSCFAACHHQTPKKLCTHFIFVRPLDTYLRYSDKHPFRFICTALTSIHMEVLSIFHRQKMSWHGLLSVLFSSFYFNNKRNGNPTDINLMPNGHITVYIAPCMRKLIKHQQMS